MEKNCVEMCPNLITPHTPFYYSLKIGIKNLIKNLIIVYISESFNFSLKFNYGCLLTFQLEHFQ